MTYANINQRTGIIRGLAREDDEQAWQILMQLIPGRTIVGGIVVYPTYLPVEHFPENRKVSIKDYYTATFEYIKIACSLLIDNVSRMETMLQVLKRVELPIQRTIISSIEEHARTLDAGDKERLWNKIKDYIAEQKQYPAKTTINDSSGLQLLEALSHTLELNEKAAIRRRYFHTDCLDFMIELGSGDWKKGQDILSEKRIKIVEEIYKESGVHGLLEFAESVENPKAVGTCAAGLVNDEEIQTVFEETEASIQDSFVRGLIECVPEKRILCIISTFADTLKLTIIQCLTLSDECLEVIKLLSSDYQKLYWSKKNLGPIHLEKEENRVEAIQQLCNFQNIESCLMLIADTIDDKRFSLSVSFVLRVLRQLEYKQSQTVMGNFYLQKIFKWMREQNLKDEVMMLIKMEIKYWTVLEEDEKYSLLLYEKMAENPKLYVHLATVVFNKESSEQGKIVGDNGYVLFSNWKSVPGIKADKKLDGKKLIAWYDDMIDLIKNESESVQYFSLEMLGKALFYSPKDKDGFFIDRNAADLLERKENEVLRNGYRTEIFNSRGAHFIDYTGKEEFALAKQYKQKADAADKEGYFRLGTVLRDMAYSYESEGMKLRKEGRRALEIH